MYPADKECNRCKQDKHITKLLSAANNADPEYVPPELTGLYAAEQMLIADIMPSFWVFKIAGKGDERI